MDLDEIPKLLAYLFGFLIYVLPLLLRAIQRQRQTTEREQDRPAPTEQPEPPLEHPAGAKREGLPWTSAEGSRAGEHHASEIRSSPPQPRAATDLAATEPEAPVSVRQRSAAARQRVVTMRAPPARPQQRSQRPSSRSVTTELPESISERARSAARHAAAAEQAMQARVPQQPLDSASKAAPIRLLSPQLVVEAVVLNTCLSRRDSDRR